MIEASQSRTLPAGFKSSAWPDLDGTARALLLTEFQVRNPDLELVGSVDYDSPREPLLQHRQTGQWFSLRGDLVSAGEAPRIAITGRPTSNGDQVLLVVLGGLLILAALS